MTIIRIQADFSFETMEVLDIGTTYSNCWGGGRGIPVNQEF